MQLYLLLNESCNLSCSFCIRGEKKDNNLNIDKWRQVLNYNDFSKYSLLITGGEPSLHKEINTIIESCKNRFREISVNTNGFDSNWLDNLAYNNIHLQISLDGTQTVHNALRSNKNIDVYSRVEETIKKIEIMGIPYNISTTVSKQNYFNMRELLEVLCNYHKMQYWKLSPLLPFGCGSFKETINISEWNSLVDFIINNSRVKLKIKKLFDFDLLDKFISDDKINRCTIISNCGNVKNKIYIYPDLTVYPCACLTDFPLGNLTDKTLVEIICNSESKKFSDYKVDKTSSCFSCKYLKLCNGGCIGMSYNYFGILGIGDYRCPLVKK